MLLGCLLGDAGISRYSPTSACRIHFWHGKAQAGYCRAKAEQLKEYVTTGPAESKNRGWGDMVVHFATVSSSAFNDIAKIVLQDGKKKVTTAWAAALDWESIAYWVMDDGTKQRSSIHFCTHRYTKEEVDLLVTRLHEMGLVSARATPVKVRGTIRYLLRLNVADSRRLATNIAPWFHPELQYKLISQQPRVTCAICGTQFAGRKDQAEAETPICKTRECYLARQRLSNKKSMTEERKLAKAEKARQRRACAKLPRLSK